MNRFRRLLLPALCSTALAWYAMGSSAAPAANPQDFLPPVLPWKGASEGLVAKPDDPWITPCEETGLTDTPNYEATVAYLRRLAAASPLIQVQEFGRSSQGRSLYLVIASRDKAFENATEGEASLMTDEGPSEVETEDSSGS